MQNLGDMFIILSFEIALVIFLLIAILLKINKNK